MGSPPGWGYLPRPFWKVPALSEDLEVRLHLLRWTHTVFRTSRHAESTKLMSESLLGGTRRAAVEMAVRMLLEQGAQFGLKGLMRVQRAIVCQVPDCQLVRFVKRSL
jgi:hypothetical protein